MVRTQIYLTPGERTGLARMARRTGRKQSELIREALDSFLEKDSPESRRAALSKLAGMWADHKDLPDARELRRSWDR